MVRRPVKTVVKKSPSEQVTRSQAAEWSERCRLSDLEGQWLWTAKQELGTPRQVPAQIAESKVEGEGMQWAGWSRLRSVASHTQLHGSEGTGLFLGGAQAGVHSIKPSRALDIADFLGQPYQAITPHFSGMRRGSKQRSTPHSLMVELA